MNKPKLQEELKQSMLARDELKTSVLRMLLSAVNYYEIQKGGAGYEATEDDILTVVQSQAKQRRDSIGSFKEAQRLDLAEKEQKELEILGNYMPALMGEDEITKLVKDAIAEIGASTPQDMGKVMSALMPKVKGKADGALVSNIVKKELISS